MQGIFGRIKKRILKLIIFHSDKKVKRQRGIFILQKNTLNGSLIYDTIFTLLHQTFLNE
jgi:hypothetical protein